tara:strand:+ start:1269 stop:1856 length:588 start_codon:yes stop_codon:yes gene_type:complete
MIEEIEYKLNSLNSEKLSGKPQAAVLIAILNYEKYINSPELIYTQRSSHLSTHSGEVSFPGGKSDQCDKNLFETALRESKEEMNLKSQDVTKLGKLNYIISRHDIEVNPFVATINKPQILSPNEEIQSIFTVPLDFLLDQKNIQREIIKMQGKIWHVPTWTIKDQKIWGLTAMITINFLNLCFDANIEILEGKLK